MLLQRSYDTNSYKIKNLDNNYSSWNEIFYVHSLFNLQQSVKYMICKYIYKQRALTRWLMKAVTYKSSTTFWVVQSSTPVWSAIK